MVFKADVKGSRMRRSYISTPQLKEWSLLRHSTTLHELLTSSNNTNTLDTLTLPGLHPSTWYVYFQCLLHKETLIVLFHVTPLQWGLHETQENTDNFIHTEILQINLKKKKRTWELKVFEYMVVYFFLIFIFLKDFPTIGRSMNKE